MVMRLLVNCNNNKELKSECSSKMNASKFENYSGKNFKVPKNIKYLGGTNISFTPPIVPAEVEFVV